SGSTSTASTPTWRSSGPTPPKWPTTPRAGRSSSAASGDGAPSPTGCGTASASCRSPWPTSSRTPGSSPPSSAGPRSSSRRAWRKASVSPSPRRCGSRSRCWPAPSGESRTRSSTADTAGCWPTRAIPTSSPPPSSGCWSTGTRLPGWPPTPGAGSGSSSSTIASSASGRTSSSGWRGAAGPLDPPVRLLQAVHPGVEGLARRGEEAPDHRLEGVEGQGLGRRIEGRGVVDLAELRRPLEAGVAPELVPEVPVHPHVVEEVVALEDGVLLHHPVVLGRHEGLEDGGGDVGVVVGAERVADVVEQGADDVLLVLPGPEGPGGRLEGVRQAVDGEAAEVAVEEAEVVEHPVGQAPAVGHEALPDDRPVLGGRRLHAGERRPRPIRLHGGYSLISLIWICGAI